MSPYANIGAEVPYLAALEVRERGDPYAFVNPSMVTDMWTSGLEVNNPWLLLLVEHDIRIIKIAVFETSLVNGQEATEDIKPTTCSVRSGLKATPTVPIFHAKLFNAEKRGFSDIVKDQACNISGGSPAFEQTVAARNDMALQGREFGGIHVKFVAKSFYGRRVSRSIYGLENQLLILRKGLGFGAKDRGSLALMES